MSTSIRRSLGDPETVRETPGKGSIEVWKPENGNINYRNFSPSGGKGDATIDFTGDLQYALGFMHFHAVHD
ncbi:hypothetical protein [Streptomyces zingiberis]|uniref:Uncharacterized protein n=1 Tax=Streptomyces zingiberis TaxID=2053010 RepID=A0ABX1C031_9ACTN|nr:hypothetical protein [Streptomyces zingiberis]NJQ02060.1 hypothetical protein [Streptomyces zingiberis]